MKTKTSRLALMEVASLLVGVRQARYNVQRDDSCGAQECGAPREYLHKQLKCFFTTIYF